MIKHIEKDGNKIVSCKWLTTIRTNKNQFVDNAIWDGERNILSIYGATGERHVGETINSVGRIQFQNCSYKQACEYLDNGIYSADNDLNS